MSNQTIPGGVVHQLTPQLTQVLTDDQQALQVWQGLTPLARNEWICWVTFPKKQETRDQHVTRMINELKEGKRRPCCWLGCIHRTDKALSPSIQGILDKQAKKS